MGVPDQMFIDFLVNYNSKNLRNSAWGVLEQILIQSRYELFLGVLLENQRKSAWGILDKMCIDLLLNSN